MKEFLPVEKKRKLVVLNSIFMKIQKTLEDSLGESAAKVLYSAGKEFGIKYMEIVQTENKEASVQDLLAELEVTGFVDAVFDPDDLHFEVLHSPIAATYESSETPVCHFLAGFFEGLIVEHYKKEDIVYKEVFCKGCGDNVCKFELVNRD